MTQHIDPIEAARSNLLAAVRTLQQCTKTAANIVPIPGTDRFVAIGAPTDVAKLLQMASTVPAEPEQVSERALDLYDAIECDLASLFGRASSYGHEVGQQLASEVRAKMQQARAALATPASTAPAQPEQALRDEVIGCFNAAKVEGLMEALANTTDERLKDLVERRLMHALYAAQGEASTAASEQQADDAHLDPDPIDDLVNTIDLGTPPEHGADLVDSEGGHHD